MNNLQLNFGGVPADVNNAVGLSFISSPAMQPDTSVAVLETYKFPKENKSTLRTYGFFQEIQGQQAHLRIQYAGTTLLAQTTNLGAWTLSDVLYSLNVGGDAIDLTAVNTPITTTGIKVTRAESWGIGITPGVIFRSYVVPAYEQSSVWFRTGALASKTTPGTKCLLIYSTPECFYPAKLGASSAVFPGSDGRYRATTEKAATGGPNRITFSGDIAVLTSIKVNGTSKYSGSYDGSASDSTIKTLNSELKYIDVSFSLAPDDVITLGYYTYLSEYTYLGFRDGQAGGYYCFDCNPEYGHFIADDRYNQIRASSDALAEQITVYAVPSAIALFTVEPPASGDDLPTAVVTFYSAYDFGESHFIRHAIGHQDEIISPRISEGPLNTFGFAVFGRNYYDETGNEQGDIFSATIPSMLPLARVLIKAPASSSVVKHADIRIRGGGIPLDFDLTNLASEGSTLVDIAGYFDMGRNDGKAVQSGGVVTITIDPSVLDTFTDAQIQEIVQQRMAPGISYDIVYGQVS